MPDLGGLPGYVALVVAGITAWVSLRRVRVDERGSVTDGLQELVKTLQSEIERVNRRSKERESEMQVKFDGLQLELVTSRADCQKQIGRLQSQINEQQDTIVSQANQIDRLERRRTSQAVSTERRRSKNGGTAE